MAVQMNCDIRHALSSMDKYLLRLFINSRFTKKFVISFSVPYIYSPNLLLCQKKCQFLRSKSYNLIEIIRGERMANEMREIQVS